MSSSAFCLENNNGQLTRYDDNILDRLTARHLPATDCAPAQTETFRWSPNGELLEVSYHTDHLGTPLALTDEQGQLLWEASPDDWAAISNERGDTAQPFRF